MRGELAIATPAWDIAANAPLINPLRGQLPPSGDALRVKKPPSGREVARRAGGREPRLCPKPSCLREALSPTACGRSPLPEGAKEFFDNLSFPQGGSLFYFHRFFFINALTAITSAAYITPPMAQMNQLYCGWPLPLGPKVYHRKMATTTSQ